MAVGSGYDSSLHHTAVRDPHLFSHFLLLHVLFCSVLFSRQRYVLGDSAMHQMAQSSVFLSGMGALGVEIGGQANIYLFIYFFVNPS